MASRITLHWAKSVGYHSAAPFHTIHIIINWSTVLEHTTRAAPNIVLPRIQIFEVVTGKLDNAQLCQDSWITLRRTTLLLVNGAQANIPARGIWLK